MKMEELEPGHRVRISYEAVVALGYNGETVAVHSGGQTYYPQRTMENLTIDLVEEPAAGANG